MNYSVQLYYHSTATIEVEASNEQEAIEKARERVTDEEILESLIEISSPDVEKVG